MIVDLSNSLILSPHPVVTLHGSRACRYRDGQYLHSGFVLGLERDDNWPDHMMVVHPPTPSNEYYNNVLSHSMSTKDYYLMI